MKVKDLIKILEKHEPDDNVVIEESHSDGQTVLGIYDEGGGRSEVTFHYGLSDKEVLEDES